jgi:SAM-dependent methyltransferase
MRAASEAQAAVIWHDVECGGYAADLGTWTALAAAAPSGTLELGCGTGRVALALARAGRRVSGLDSDSELLEALRERAQAHGLEIATHQADAREFELGERFGLVAAPMQLVQLLDEAGRRSMLGAMARHLVPGGRAALAIAAEPPAPWRADRDSHPPPPDVRELDGWVYSSLPLGVELEEAAVVVRRLRQSVSPEGSLTEREHTVRLRDLPAEVLEAEALEAGLCPAARRAVPATSEHLGSLVIVLEGSG